MNNVILVGRVANSIELKEVNIAEGEGIVTRFSLAVDNGRINTDHDAYFISCVAWNKIAQAIGKYIQKGDKLAIQGHLRPNSYKKDNQAVYSMDVVVDWVEFMNKPKSENKSDAAAEQGGQSPYPDDKNVNRGGNEAPF